MAEGDNRAKYGGTAQVAKDTTIGGGTAKANPTAMVRLPEDEARSAFYAGTAANGNDHAALAQTQKDELPEHKARRDAYPHITATS